MPTFLLVLCIGALPATAAAQQEQPAAAREPPADPATDEIEEVDDVQEVEAAPSPYGPEFATVDRMFNLLTSRPARPRTLLLVLDHRAHEAISEDPWHDYLGLDGGSLKMGLGLRYGIVAGLDVGLLRMNGTAELFDTYEIDARYQLLAQERFPVSVALRAGLSWFSQKDHPDAIGYFGQLTVDRVLADRLLVGLAALFHSDSSNDRKSTVDTSYSLAAAGYVEVRLVPALALGAEISQTVLGYHSPYPAFAAGCKVYTYQHTFALVVTNTQYTGADGMVANTWRGHVRNFIIGFSLTREFP